MRKILCQDRVEAQEAADSVAEALAEEVEEADSAAEAITDIITIIIIDPSSTEAGAGDRDITEAVALAVYLE